MASESGDVHFRPATFAGADIPTRFCLREVRDDDASSLQAIVYSVLQSYGLSPEPEGVDADLKSPYQSYQLAGKGSMWAVCEKTDQHDSPAVVGCFALFDVHHPHECELRKMYLVPSVRGCGIGKACVLFFIEQARQRGYSRIVLDTASVLQDAIRLYEKCGFRHLSSNSKCARCDTVMEMQLVR
eukprot:ANDGO_02211.mRNA.1 putative N-acetyltransferase YjgM